MSYQNTGRNKSKSSNQQKQPLKEKTLKPSQKRTYRSDLGSLLIGRKETSIVVLLVVGYERLSAYNRDDFSILGDSEDCLISASPRSIKIDFDTTRYWILVAEPLHK